MSNILLSSSRGISEVTLDASLRRRRILVLQEKVSDQSAMAFYKQLLHLNLESDAPITCLIHNLGGEVSSGLMLYDALVDSPAPVRTVCVGQACSMAALLFCCTKERLMLPNSELMLHQPLLGGNVSGNASSIQSISESLLATKNRLNRLIAAHTGKSEQEIDAATSYDHYFNPEEAIRFGLCDRVISFGELIRLLQEEE